MNMETVRLNVQNKEDAITTKSVLIGMACYNASVPLPTVQSLLQLVKPCPTAFMAVERQRIDKARNAIAMEALNKGAEYLLFVDDDNPIPPDTLVSFLEDDKDIVTAPILGRNPDKNGGHHLCVFNSKTHEVDGKGLRLYSPINEFIGSGYLHEVDACGMGCVLIKRKVLETLYCKYQNYMFEFGDIKFNKVIEIDGVMYDRRTMSEDCEFSERAVDAGFKIWVDARIRPIHLTRMGGVQWRGDE